MAVGLYMDHNAPRAIALALRLRDVAVLTAVEDGSHELSDPDLLDRASALGRALFTRDDDLLAEGARRQTEGLHFQGIIFAHQLRVSIGAAVADLEIIAKVAQPEELANAILFLPL